MKNLKNSLDQYNSTIQDRMVIIKNIPNHKDFFLCEDLRLRNGRYFTAVYDVSYKVEDREVEIDELEILSLFVSKKDEMFQVSEIKQSIHNEMTAKLSNWHEENIEFPTLSEMLEPFQDTYFEN